MTSWLHSCNHIILQIWGIIITSHFLVDGRNLAGNLGYSIWEEELGWQELKILYILGGCHGLVWETQRSVRLRLLLICLEIKATMGIIFLLSNKEIMEFVYESVYIFIFKLKRRKRFAPFSLENCIQDMAIMWELHSHIIFNYLWVFSLVRYG